MRDSGAATSLTVVHVGVVGPELPGGMAQVIEEYVNWAYSAIKVRALCSSKGRGDRLSVVRALVAATTLLLLRIRLRRLVVVVHLSQKGSFLREGALIWWAAALRIPVAAHLHGSEFESFATRHAVLVAKVLRPCVSVFVLTEASRDKVAACIGTSRRIVIVSNSVRAASSSAAKKKMVVFGGAVCVRKGVDVLLEAWQLAAAENPEWNLVVAGPVDPGISVSGWSTSIVFTGAVPRSEVLQLLAEASIAVLPSRHEAMPVFLLEAMARRCAVVSTPVGMIPDMVGDAGTLIEAGSVSQLAAVFNLLLSDPDRCSDLGKAAYDRYLDKFSPVVVAQALESEWVRLSQSKVGI